MLVIPVFIPHRGCPHHCLFCNQVKIAGQGTDERPPVAATIEEWLARSPGRAEVQVAFFGGSFTCLPVDDQLAMLSAVQPFISSGRVDCIRLSTRPDCLSGEICRLLKEYRVGVVELGVQSMDDRVLAASRRGHDGDQVKRAVILLRRSGFTVGVQLMVGLPGETTRSFLRGIAAVIVMRPDFVRLYPVLVVKDSGLELLYRQGRFRPLSLGAAVALTANACEKLGRAGIKVVRMGLQPSESLAASLVAGPFHPAFGELVQARLWLKKIRTELALLGPGEHLAIHISPKDRSAVAGIKKQNIERLKQLGFAGRFTIVPEKSMERGSIRYVIC
jgi:histone acetyltransferase (RNA polymerase elongator complex component)